MRYATRIGIASDDVSSRVDANGLCCHGADYVDRAELASTNHEAVIAGWPKQTWWCTVAVNAHHITVLVHAAIIERHGLSVGECTHGQLIFRPENEVLFASARHEGACNLSVIVDLEGVCLECARNVEDCELTITQQKCTKVAIAWRPAPAEGAESAHDIAALVNA